MSNKKMKAFVESNPDRGGFTVRLEIGHNNFELSKSNAELLRLYLSDALYEIEKKERRSKALDDLGKLDGKYL